MHATAITPAGWKRAAAGGVDVLTGITGPAPQGSGAATLFLTRRSSHGAALTLLSLRTAKFLDVNDNFLDVNDNDE